MPAWVAYPALLAMAGIVRAAGADPTPLLTYAASQSFPPILAPATEAAFRKKLDRITFNLSKDPPPDTDCAHTLGAKRFANLLDDLGGVYADMGDDARAVDAYAKAISCNPRAEFLHAQLAASLLDLGRYAEARTETQRELSLGRGNFTLHNLMTQLDFIEHRWPQAIENARLAVIEAPDDEQATYWQCFLWLAQLHEGVASPSLPDRRTASGWPAPILHSLRGIMSEAELVDSVSSEHNAARRREILSEALFYTGQKRLASKQTDEAIRYFNATTGLQVQYFIEHHLAVAELQRLRHRIS
jgi:lipoprotein NlpI